MIDRLVKIANMLDEKGGSPNWNDYSYGIILKQKFKNILFNLNIEKVKSKNYSWLDNYNTNNFFIFFNTIYLW